MQQQQQLVPGLRRHHRGDSNWRHLSIAVRLVIVVVVVQLGRNSASPSGQRPPRVPSSDYSASAASRKVVPGGGSEDLDRRGGEAATDDDMERPWPESCTQCPARQMKKDYRLAAIKEDILRKLRLTAAPNITGRQLPQIPPLEGLSLTDDDGMLSDPPTGGATSYDGGDDDRATTVQMMLFPVPVPEVNKPDAFKFRIPRDITSSKEISKATLGVYIRRARPHPSANVKSFILLYRTTALPARPGLAPTRERILRRPINLTDDETDCWYQINVQQYVSQWIDNPSSNYGLFFETSDQYGNSLPIVTPQTHEEEAKKPYLEIFVNDQSSSRSKRNLDLDCDEHSSEKRCCRYPLVVDFDLFGWNWVIVPRRYSAYYCAGECSFVYHQQNPHPHLVHQQLQSSRASGQRTGGGGSSTAVAATGGPCCSPRRVSSISMLYYDENMNIVYGRLPGMVVEQCGCS
jgi:growth differentiation factor 8/11